MRISLTEYIVMIVLLMALVCGVYRFYERNLSGLAQVTVERVQNGH